MNFYNIAHKNSFIIFKKFFNETKNFKLIQRCCSIRRALLYVPGSDEKKLKKALNFTVDCIAMDCEDGVANNQKETARETIKKILDELSEASNDTNLALKPEYSVRVNSVYSKEICEADLNLLLSAKMLPNSICLPKVDHIDHLQWFAEKVWNILIKRPENDRGPIKLIMYAESPISVMNLPKLCQKAIDISTMAPIVPVALVFGSDDLLANLGASRTATGVELLYARQKMVLIAKAFGFQAIDMVNINYKDLNELKRECNEGALMGFTGKQVIHPDQIKIVQESFVPSSSKINWAKKVINAFEQNQNKGKGAFELDNAMIDMPSFRQAQNILKTAEAAKKRTQT